MISEFFDKNTVDDVVLNFFVKIAYFIPSQVYYRKV